MDAPQVPDGDDGFRDLMRRVREGSEEAAWELVERYGDAIRRAVRRALNQRLRSKFDSLDFVQVVWSSFFRAREKLGQFSRPEELVAFLVAVTRKKVAMEVRRRLLTEKYNLNRECSLDEPGVWDRADQSGTEPTPIDVAIAREQWDRMLRSQPAHYRQIIHFRLQGCTYQEIADSLHLAESTVRRFVKKLFRRTVA